MKSVTQALWFGFITWLVPFVVAVAIFPLKKADDPLFETTMPLVVTLCAVFCVNGYFAGHHHPLVREGVLLGAIWMAVSLSLDACMFAWGPMKMSFATYMKDIGLGYLIFPTITAGAGWLRSRAGTKHENTPEAEWRIN